MSQIFQLLDFQSSVSIASAAELEQALKKRYGDANGYYLCPIGKKYPMMHILIRGSEAVLHLFTEDRTPGYISRSIASRDRTDTVTFQEDLGGQEIEVSAESVIPADMAILAAREFFRSLSIPQSVHWLKL